MYHSDLLTVCIPYDVLRLVVFRDLHQIALFMASVCTTLFWKTWAGITHIVRDDSPSESGRFLSLDFIVLRPHLLVERDGVVLLGIALLCYSKSRILKIPIGSRRLFHRSNDGSL